MNKYILTKEEFLEMYNPDISKRVYTNTSDKIDNRFNEITKHLFSYLSGNSPDVEYANRFYTDNPYFDFDGYVDYIKIDRDLSNCLYENDKSLVRKIPTRWLWEENYLTEYNRENVIDLN